MIIQRRFPRFSVITFASVLFFSYVALSKGNSDCEWFFDPRPPSNDNPLFGTIFCNPFINDSILTLPCQVTGPTEVELDWYFASSNGNVKLMNSSKHSLAQSVLYNNDSVIVTLNVTFSNLDEDSDGGNYFCKATVKTNGNILSPSPDFIIKTPQFSLFQNTLCNETPKASDKLCADEEAPPSSSLAKSTSTQVLVSITPVHLMPTLATPVSSLAKSTSTQVLVSTTPVHLMPTLATPVLSPSISNTPELTKSSYSLTKTTTTNPPSNAVEQTPLIHSSPVSKTDNTDKVISSFTTNNVINKTSIGVPIVETGPAIRKATDGNTDVSPPVNTWFYLLSVVVVLTFLMIILILILVIFCIMQRKTSSRQTVHLPPSAEEIGILRTGRQPSDPLPRIRDSLMEGVPISTNPLITKLPDHQVTFVHSAPLNNTTRHAMSLQHLSFNLSPSFESNNTLYDEIGPPRGLLPDIMRGSHDYVNRWQFTLQSDSTDASYVLPPSDAHQGSQELSCCIEMPPHVDDTDDITSDNDAGDNTGSDGSVWFNQHSPLIVSQSNVPWQGNDTLDCTPDADPPEADVLINIEECSESVCLSQDLPEVYSEGESDDSNSNCCVIVRENDSSILQRNTLDGQMFELNLECAGNDDSLLNSRFLSDSRTLHSDSSPTENRLTFCQNPPIHISSICDLPVHLPKNTKPLSPNDSDNSRSSSSTSGCTDVSKYSGDYDRDPAYMRLLLNRARPLLRPLPTSPEFMNGDFSAEVRADSGTESLYREPAPLVPLTDKDIAYQHSNNNIYKSLNNLSLEPESIYMQSSLSPPSS